MNNSIDQLLRSPVSFLADSGPEEDIALSSRIRLARNLAGRPFPAAASLESRREVCELVSQAAAGSGALGCPECYSFDPAESVRQIDGWVEELKPSLIVGESLGSLNAIRIKGLPHILISPSLNAPLYLGYLAFLTKIPGMTALLDLIYRPKEGDRQPLHFTYGVMRRYLPLRKEALDNSIAAGSKDYFFSFFGTGDHYRRSGIVSVRTYRKYFGGTYCIYPGTHFMEEEFIISMLIPKIKEVLGR